MTTARKSSRVPAVGAEYSVIGSVLGERLDCTVRALAVACGVPYSAAHDYMRRAGRKHASCASTSMQETALEFATGVAGFTSKSGNRVTLARFMREHPAGRFVLHFRDHAVALIDGRLHNWGSVGGNVRVRWVFEVLSQKG